MCDLSIVIPVYNNEGTLVRAYTELREAAEAVTGPKGLQFVFVDDYSKDGSARILSDLMAADPAVSVVSHAQREGQLMAIRSGLMQAHCDVTVVTSADLQNPSHLVQGLYAAVREGNQLAVAYRFKRADRGVQSLGSRLFYRLMAYLYPRIPSGGFDYGAIDREVRAGLLQQDFSRIALQLEVFRLAERVAYMPSHRSARGPDGSGWTMTDRCRYALLFLNYFDLMNKGRLASVLALPLSFLIVVLWSL